MDAHTLYPMFYALTALVSTGVIGFAMHTRYMRDGTPVNWGLLKALGGVTVVLWSSTAFVAAIYA
jgi:4-amino-4-deoxy-L-arabinose transferase-like glycosyltransferase